MLKGKRRHLSVICIVISIYAKSQDNINNILARILCENKGGIHECGWGKQKPAIALVPRPARMEDGHLRVYQGCQAYGPWAGTRHQMTSEDRKKYQAMFFRSSSIYSSLKLFLAERSEIWCDPLLARPPQGSMCCTFWMAFLLTVVVEWLFELL